MRNPLSLFLLLIFLSYENVVYASDYHFFYSMGPLLSNPGNMRIGTVEWEFGMLGSGFGFNKIIHAQGGSSYLAFGLGTAGFYGGMGLMGNLFWRFDWRLELASTVDFDKEAGGFGLLGFNFNF